MSTSRRWLGGVTNQQPFEHAETSAGERFLEYLARGQTATLYFGRVDTEDDVALRRRVIVGERRRRAPLTVRERERLCARARSPEDPGRFIDVMDRLDVDAIVQRECDAADVVAEKEGLRLVAFQLADEGACG